MIMYGPRPTKSPVATPKAITFGTVGGWAILSPSPASPAAAPSFTYDRTHFLLNGEPYQIIGGQMDPQRIPRSYWRDRLRKARAMGLNTVFPYVFWNMLEPVQGAWNNTGENDIAAFFRIAQEEGLHVVLRPGPYVCGEREWGGFPAWLASIPGMLARAYNEPFLAAAKSYLQSLAKDLGSLQVSQGGPILMIQVENEYGSFGADHNYTAAIRDILRETFDAVLYTNDGTVDWTIEGGSVPGVLAEIDGDPWSGFAALRKYVTDPSRQGPMLDGEYYTWAPDQWGSSNTHNTTEGRPEVVQQFVNDLDYVIGNESASISLYMVHGGTNFGFSNGALWQNRTTAFTSSYDYGSPIDESGRTNDLYHALRDTIQQYVTAGSIPDVPEDLPRMEIPQFSLSPAVALFDIKGDKKTGRKTLAMETLGQAYGFTLYEHTATSFVKGHVQPGDRARDRVLVFVDGIRQGVIDSQYQHPLDVDVDLSPGSKLQLLVENLGRVDYYSRGNPYRNYLQDPYKGIVGDVKLNSTILEGWDMYTLPLDDVSRVRKASANVSASSTPLFYHGTFQIDKPTTTNPAELDTFLALPAGVKGNVWVNAFHLGRYWRVGPQQSLYLPGTVIKAGNQVNEVVVLELEPDQVKGEMVAIGQRERVWGNHPDDDCLRCI
ncbi:glycoside hydrolase family 35 protein [Trematosphaeria pertusa]|uniref:Beta-galactosidase n=1 Tax=Trematosphaeria pertusa TaxID=390896 RepID=A0A6A6IV57_9PLEO|nr:glycoside hydrolase family 35 protein [Trematosphaeria pertusa]KAF2254324.1 glycoside hydrolase family 35 protein [Trematosphaeria pertusa]